MTILYPKVQDINFEYMLCVNRRLSVSEIVKNELQQCKSADELHAFVKDLKVHVSFWGGRKLYKENSHDTVSVNDVVKHLNAIYQQTYAKQKDLHSCIQLLSTVKKIEIKDSLGHSKLAHSNVMIRIFTALKRYFTNRGFDRYKVLNDIKAHTSPVVEQYEQKRKAHETLVQKYSHMPLAELIQEVDFSLSSLSASIDIDIIENQTEETHRIIKNAVLVCIQGLIKEKRLDELKAVFMSLQYAPTKFVDLAMFVSDILPYTIHDLDQFFNGLIWPTEELKEQKIPEILALRMSKKAVRYDVGQIKYGNNGHMKTFRAVVDPREIFGLGNFNQNPLLVSNSVVKAFRLLVEQLGHKACDQLKQALRKDLSLENKKIGLELSINPYTECDYPASMITPFLAPLCQVPGLVKLDLSNIGTQTENNLNSLGFGDQEADAILEIVRTNPYLQEFMIETPGMSVDVQKQFDLDWKDILSKRPAYQPRDLVNLLIHSSSA